MHQQQPHSSTGIPVHSDTFTHFFFYYCKRFFSQQVDDNLENFRFYDRDRSVFYIILMTTCDKIKCLRISSRLIIVLLW